MGLWYRYTPFKTGSDEAAIQCLSPRLNTQEGSGLKPPRIFFHKKKKKVSITPRPAFETTIDTVPI